MNRRNWLMSLLTPFLPKVPFLKKGDRIFPKFIVSPYQERNTIDLINLAEWQKSLYTFPNVRYNFPLLITKIDYENKVITFDSKVEKKV